MAEVYEANLSRVKADTTYGSTWRIHRANRHSEGMRGMSSSVKEHREVTDVRTVLDRTVKDLATLQHLLLYVVFNLGGLGSFDLE